MDDYRRESDSHENTSHHTPPPVQNDEQNVV
jgi:hypothetical protein